MAGGIFGAIAQLAGSGLQSKAASEGGKEAAAAQLQAAQMQDQLARDLYNSQLGVSGPYREAGYTALSALMDMSGLSRSYNLNQGYDGSLGGNVFGLGGAGGVQGRDQFGNSYGSDMFGVPSMFSGLDPKSIPIQTILRPLGLRRLLGGGSNHNPENMLKQINMQQWDLSKIPMPTNDGYWGKKTEAEWKSYLEGIQKDPNHVIDGPSRINAHLRDYVTNKAQQYAVRKTGATGGVGASGANAVNPGQIGGGSQILAGKPGYQWQTDPGYQFRLSEGMRSLEGSAAARGGLLSGNFARDATAYGQQMGSQEYSNVYNRLANIAGLGQVGVSAAGQGGALAAQLGANSAQNVANAGYYRGSAYANQGNIIGGGLSQLGQLAGSYFGGRGGGGGGGAGIVAGGGGYGDLSSFGDYGSWSPG